MRLWRVVEKEIESLDREIDWLFFLGLVDCFLFFPPASEGSLGAAAVLLAGLFFCALRTTALLQRRNLLQSLLGPP